MENEVLSLLIDCQKGTVEGQLILGSTNPIEVSIGQFYGIEINDFAVTVAKTALWIAESQMMKETETVVHMNLNFLPLKTNAHIVEGNALRVDWESVVPRTELNYIMGNPPFVGANNVTKQQKSELLELFGKDKKAGLLDYVSGWYKKATDLVISANIKAAFVSTNSITQGEQTSILWKPLFQNGIHIDFAYRTFRWDSEAKIKAHVHCVIIGFSKIDNDKKRLFSNDRYQIVDNINAYLLDAPDVFIDRRTKPICDVPKCSRGNQPTDGGNLIIEAEGYEAFIKKEPNAKKYIKKLIGAYEFINQKDRYCLWLIMLRQKK